MSDKKFLIVSDKVLEISIKKFQVEFSSDIPQLPYTGIIVLNSKDLIEAKKWTNHVIYVKDNCNANDFEKYTNEKIILLPIPFSNEQLQYCLEFITEFESDNSQANPLALAQQKYIQSIPEKLHLLETYLDENNQESLRAYVHKIAGSAGIYGFAKVSLICKEWQKKQQNPLHNKDNHYFFLQTLFYYQFPHPLTF